MLSYRRRPSRVDGENIRSSPALHPRKFSSRRYVNNRCYSNGHSNSSQSRHGGFQHQRDTAGGAQSGGQTATALTVFQPQQGVPLAPTCGAQASSMRDGSAFDPNPNGRQPRTFRTNWQTNGGGFELLIAPTALTTRTPDLCASVA